MMLKTLLTAAAASALLTGAAFAQEAPTATSKNAAPPSSQAGVDQTDTDTSASAPGAVNPPATATPEATTSTDTTTTADGTTATSATSMGANASVTTTTLTNGPVPDTAENRAKYGQPLSHAGKRTAAKGN